MTTMPADPLATLLSLADYERAATERMSEPARALHPQRRRPTRSRCATTRPPGGGSRCGRGSLAATGGPDLSVQLLGVRRPHPVLIAPTAFAGLTHPDGDLGIARGRGGHLDDHVPGDASGLGPASWPLRRPAGPRWFQLYVYTDRGVSRELIDAAAAHGYEALVVTVDRPVLGLREREVQRRPALPVMRGPRTLRRSTRRRLSSTPTSAGTTSRVSPPTARCRSWSRACSRPRMRGWPSSTARPA